MAQQIAKRNEERVERTVAPIRQNQSVESDILQLGFHTKAFTKQQQQILTQEIRETDIDIHPVTGALYLTQVKYRRILSDAFGVGGWAFLPYRKPIMTNNTIIRSYYLIVNGKIIAEATGAADYIPSNAQMTYADALEAAKSDALKKACKDLCIATECWDSNFCKEYKAKYCETYTDYRGKRRWKKRDNGDEEMLTPQEAPAPKKASPKKAAPKKTTAKKAEEKTDKLSDKQIKKLYAMAYEVGIQPKSLPQLVDVKSFKQMKQDDFDMLQDFLERKKREKSGAEPEEDYAQEEVADSPMEEDDSFIGYGGEG